jgi:cell division protein FtsW (lipid II flippase)
MGFNTTHPSSTSAPVGENNISIDEGQGNRRLRSSGDFMSRLRKHAVDVVVAFRRHPSGVWLIAGAGCGIGVLWSFPASACQLVGRVGVSESDCGIMSGFAVVLGLAAAAVVSIHVDRTRIYREPLLLLLSVCAAALALVALLLGSVSPLPTFAVGAAFVAAVIPLFAAFAVFFEAAAEETFPLDEVSSSNLLNASGSVFALIVMNVVPAVLQSSPEAAPSVVIILLFAAVTAMAAFGMWKWVPTRARFLYEQREKQTRATG